MSSKRHTPSNKLLCTHIARENCNEKDVHAHFQLLFFLFWLWKSIKKWQAMSIDSSLVTPTVCTIFSSMMMTLFCVARARWIDVDNVFINIDTTRFHYEMRMKSLSIIKCSQSFATHSHRWVLSIECITSVAITLWCDAIARARPT